ncbi:MAG: hypothetical protein RIR26_1776 [Pseudomonadota bacterium]
MKLYLIPTCPFVQRVLIALRLRGISEETIQTVEIDLSRPPQAMLAINPAGSVPTLEIEPESGFNESLLIMEFLDSLKSGGAKLFGGSPLAVAQRKMHLERGNAQFLGALQQILYSQGNANTLRKAMRAFADGCGWLEAELKKSGGPFLGGPSLDAVDVAFAPFVARLPYLPDELRAQFDDAIPLPAAEYFKRIASHPAVVASMPSEDVMRTTTHRFLKPHALLADVIAAPRTLLENPQAEVKRCGDTLSAWSVHHDGQGYCLTTKFTFPDHNDAVNKMMWLHDAQETADHHTAFILKDFATLDITLVTHEPRWGVTQKDLAFAKAIQTFFTFGKLP